MLGYLEDTGYPTYDPDAAVEEMDTCLSELGTDSIEFTFNTTNDPFNVESNALIISMWDEAFGDSVHDNDHARSSRASTSASRSPVPSTPSAGATTAASTPATQSYWWSSRVGRPDRRRWR